jgi:multidrug efflux pump subunit AcrB
VDSSQANENEIMAEVTASVLPSILLNHPQITYSLEGTQNEQRESFQGLGKAFAFAVLAIYALLAIPFKSYVQPFIVLSAVPFGLVGAIWGHLIMGMDLSVLSLCGMVALTGVVVNDSLILVDYVNRNVRTGIPLFEAVRTAGVARFRPIILTSLTTFAGLTPLLLETSVQAQVLIPMAVSLGFGVLFATLITLLIVPCSYTILEDLKVLFARIFWGQPREEEELPASAVPSPEWSRVPSLTESIPD